MVAAGLGSRDEDKDVPVVNEGAALGDRYSGKAQAGVEHSDYMG